MKYFVLVSMIISLSLFARRADAHGTPIIVSGANGVFTVSGGVTDAEGFAPQMFYEVNDEGDATGPIYLPTFDDSFFLWGVPGYRITNMPNASSLSIELISRPVKDSSPLENRVLWYWNPNTPAVEPATSEFYLLGTEERFVTISLNDSVAPPPFLLAQTLTGQQNSHNHGLLSYALKSTSSTADGAYALFARLISSQYGPSDPFLMVFNHNVNYEQMTNAALAINAAASDADSPSGDYNFDNAVDAADYVFWRKSLGGGPAYTTWRENFSRTIGGGGANTAREFGVPEPAAMWMTASAIVFFACRRSRRPKHRTSAQWSRYA